MGICISNTSIEQEIDSYTIQEKNVLQQNSNYILSVTCSSEYTNISSIKSPIIKQTSKPILAKLQTRKFNKLH